jgi:IMP dehydrogenase
MDTLVGVDMAIAISKNGSVAFYPRFAPTDIQVAEVKQILDAGCFTVPSVGIKPGEMDRAQKLIDLGINILLVDVAHGYQQTCLDFVKQLKSKFPTVELIVGAVATYDSAKALFEAGADTIKVGVGSGSVCTTRIMTGSGMPQLTAILECARAAREFDRPLLADGGLKNSGDVVKALAAGANTVMSGNLFAGCLETPGETKEINGKLYKSYNGSTSAAEKQRQITKNSAEKSADYTKYVEGVERLVPVRGPISEIIEQLDKGIRSGLTYSGALNINELHEKARFVQVTSSIIFENNNRDITQL